MAHRSSITDPRIFTVQFILIPFITPGVNSAIPTPRRLFPLGLGRQAKGLAAGLAQPLAKGSRVIPRNSNNRMVFFPGRDFAFAPMVWHAVFRCFDKHSVLLIRNWVLADEKLRNVNPMLRLLTGLGILVFGRVAAHEKFAGRDADQFEVNRMGDGEG